MSPSDPTANPIPRTPETVARLLKAIASDAELSARLAGVELDTDAVGKRSPYFRATDAKTGAAALLKLNLSRYEIAWSVALAAMHPPLTPRVFAHGESIDGRPLRWLLQERLAPNRQPDGDPVRYLAEAGSRFHLVARAIDAPRAPEFDAARTLSLLDRAAALDLPGPIGSLIRRFPDDWAAMTTVVRIETIHGDLHPGNVLLNEEGSLQLIGMHSGPAPWVFEAAWYEGNHLFIHPEAEQLHIVEAMDDARVRLGLAPIHHDRARVCAIVRGWSAAEVWVKQSIYLLDDPARQAAGERVIDRAVNA